MKQGRCYGAALNTTGGMSFEPFVGDDAPPAQSPGGPQLSWPTKEDAEAAFATAEAAMAEYLPILKVVAHYKANGNVMDASLMQRINNDQSPVVKLDLTGIAGVIVV